MIYVTYDFNKCCDYGKYVQLLGAYCLQRIYPKIKIVDVSENCEYQTMDVDYLVYHKNKEYMIDIKSDYRIGGTNNIMIEWEMFRLHSKRWMSGWGKTSHSDYIIFFCRANYYIYIMDLKTAKKEISSNNIFFDTNITPNISDGGKKN